MEDRIYYFAYGSNMDIDQMRERCAEELDPICIGYAQGCNFIINSRGVATIIPDDAKSVYGILWAITHKQVEKIDKCEGVKYGTYTPEILEIETAEYGTLNCRTYIAANTTPGAPKEGYLEKIISAAMDHHFPEDYIDELKKWE